MSKPKYQCCKCGHTFKRDKPGIVPECPKCGHEYIRWRNYKPIKENSSQNG